MKNSASKLKQDNATDMILVLVKKDNRQGTLEGLNSLSYTPIKDQSIPYSSTGMLGSVMGAGKGPDWHSVLYYWLIPNRYV